MSDGQAGARKDKATRNNNFVLNACMNEAVQKKDNLDLIILDVKKAFDYSGRLYRSLRLWCTG